MLYPPRTGLTFIATLKSKDSLPELVHLLRVLVKCCIGHTVSASPIVHIQQLVERRGRTTTLTDGRTDNNKISITRMNHSVLFQQCHNSYNIIYGAQQVCGLCGLLLQRLLCGLHVTVP